MAMGFGCNAAGVISTRVIDSPRERLIAILTNNFVPCNGRFPTLIMLATVFVAAAFPPALASFAAAGSVVAVVLIGVFFTLAVSWTLSRTVLKGEASAFTLELPPYRRPNVEAHPLHLADRPHPVRPVAGHDDRCPGGRGDLADGQYLRAGGILATHVANFLNPLGMLIGLDGVILLAYIIAIPANEIVVPTMLMVYMGAGMMTDLPSYDELQDSAGRPARLDDADRGQPDAVLAAAQPVRHDHHDHLQGDRQPQVGHAERGDHAGTGVHGHVLDSYFRPLNGLGIIQNIL